MLLTVMYTAARTVNHDALLARYLTMDSDLEPLQARDFGSISTGIYQRGLHLSNINNGPLQRAASRPTLASKPGKSSRSADTRPSEFRKIPPEIQNAKQRTIPPSLGQGRTSRRPQTLMSSKPMSQNTPRPAGGGTIGHSRIPPKVPKEYPRVERMQIPPSPAEEKRDKPQPSKPPPEKSDQPKSDKSQDTDQKKDGGSPPKEPKIWEDGNPFRGPGARPPALTSIDDF